MFQPPNIGHCYWLMLCWPSEWFLEWDKCCWFMVKITQMILDTLCKYLLVWAGDVILPQPVKSVYSRRAATSFSSKSNPNPWVQASLPSSSLPFLHWYTSLVELDQVDWTGFYTIMLFPRTTILRKQSKSDFTLYFQHLDLDYSLKYKYLVFLNFTILRILDRGEH